MKDYDFKIKISDLLQQPGSKDTVKLENKFSTHIPQLTGKGVSCQLDLIGLDNKTIMVEITNCKADLDTQCDSCGKSIIYQLQVDSQTLKVFIGGDKELEDDDTIVVDETEGVINLEEYITNSLLLKDDIVHKCDECKNKEIDDNLEEESGSVVWKFST